eukprot:Gb_20901 [translate_table: standard]
MFLCQLQTDQAVPEFYLADCAVRDDCLAIFSFSYTTQVATEAKQKRKQQAKKKEELRLQLEKELRGTKEDTRLNKYLPLSEQPLEISGQEELGPKQLLNSASDAAQEYQEVLNKEGMLPDSIVNFLVGREKYVPAFLLNFFLL